MRVCTCVDSTHLSPRLTIFHVVDGGEVLDPAAHHTALSPQFGALSGRWQGVWCGVGAGCTLLRGGGLCSLVQLNAVLNEAAHQLRLCREDDQ